MAKKKSTTSAVSTSKAAAKKSAAPKATTARAAKPKAADTATNAKAAAPKKAAAKKAPAVKLTDKQREVLAKIASAGEGGYNIEQKIEQRTVDALKEKKLVKKGAKNKETGNIPYHTTKAGEKALAAASNGAAH